MRALRCVDLFCCAGGSTCGLRQAGIDVVLGMDWDEAALRVYRRNHAHPAERHDLGNVEAAVSRIRAAGDIDVISASPPCTDFSSAGARLQRPSVAGLTVSTARIAATLKTRCVMIENVPEMTRSACWVVARDILVEAGYSLVVLALNAAACGVGQVRRRVVVVALRGCGEAALRTLQRQAAGLNRTPANAPTVRSCLDDTEADIYWLPCRNSPCIRSTDLPAPTLLCKCLQQPPPCYTPRHDDAGPLSEAHVLSVQEMARLASFEPHYFDGVSRTAAGSYIGNCVCPKVAETVGKWLLQLLKSPDGGGTPAEPLYLHTMRRGCNRQSRLQRLVDNGVVQAGGELSGDGQSLRYTGGTSADGDGIVRAYLLHGPIEAGWKIQLTLRRTPTISHGQAPKDDLCILLPSYDQHFRSAKQLYRTLAMLPG